MPASTAMNALKSHHESVQNAFEAFYGAGVRTPRTSTDSADSTLYAPSTSSKESTWSNIKQSLISQHKAANAAVDSFYGGGGVVKQSTTSKPSLAKVTELDGKNSSTWDNVKLRVKQHHKAVNGAYALYYGGAGRY